MHMYVVRKWYSQYGSFRSWSDLTTPAGPVPSTSVYSTLSTHVALDMASDSQFTNSKGSNVPAHFLFDISDARCKIKSSSSAVAP